MQRIIIAIAILLFPTAIYAAFPTRSIVLERASNQYLTAADSASLDNLGNQTHEGWMKLDTAPSGGSNEYHIFSKYTAGGTSRALSVIYEDSSGTKRFHARTSADGSNVSEGTLNYTITTDVWAHYAFVYSTSGQIEIFVNGSSIGTITGLTTSIKNTDATYNIGGNSGFGNSIDASFTLWRVWGTALNSSSINANKCTTLGSTANLDAEWTLDNVLTDNSGNSNTLTNVNTAVFATDVPVCLIVTPAGVGTFYWGDS